MKHYYRYITDRYLFRIVISLLLAGAVTVSIIYKDLLWIVISSLLLAMETVSPAYTEGSVSARCY